MKAGTKPAKEVIILTMRGTEQERNLIQDMADLHGLSLNQYARQCMQLPKQEPRRKKEVKRVTD